MVLVLFSTLLMAKGFDLPITTKSNDAKNIFKEGRAYLENVHITKAAKLFDKAIQIDNDFALAHLYRAITYVGGYNVARNHINKAVKLIDKVTGGEKNLILYQQAILNGDQVRQKMYLDNLIVSFPYNKRIQQLAGNYYYVNSDYETALIHLRKSVKIDPNYAPSYNMIGYAESSLENWDKAEEAFKRYIELMPAHPNPYDSYAELLLNRGKYDESIKHYKKAYEFDNTFNSALIGIGHNYIFKGDFNKARDYYTQTIDNAATINQRLSGLYWNGTSYLHEGKYDEAMKIFNKRKKLAQKEGLTTTVINAINLEGFILTEIGQEAKGMKKFKQASSMIETSDIPKELKSNLMLNNKLNMCYSLASNNRIEEAEKEAIRCEKMVNERGNPNEIQNLHATLAMLEMKKGNHQNAVNHFEKTDVKNSPFNMKKLGEAYEKMGNSEMSNKYYNLAKMSNLNGVGSALIRKSMRD